MVSATRAVSPTFNRIGLVAVGVVALCVIAQTLGAGQLFYVIATFGILAFALVHGALRYGWPMMLFFLALVTVVSWSFESLSIMTGFPFGFYVYADFFPFGKIGLVPIMIMPAYFAMGYLSWAIAAVLLDKRDACPRGAEVILLPVIASFVMVGWDMSMDPFNSTMNGAWVWTNGGAYFGVPFVNYLGWYVCVFSFFFIFSVVLSRRLNDETSPMITSRLFWLLPIGMYLTRVPQYFIVPFVVPDREVTSNDGHIWWTHDIMWILALVSIFTMIFMSLMAFVRVYRSDDLT